MKDSQFARFTPKMVAEVLADLSFKGNGGRLYYVVDPCEIVTYCFPHRSSERDPDRLADDQIALHHVFHELKPKPVIAPAYSGELDRYYEFIRGELRCAADQSDWLRAIIRGADVEVLQQGDLRARVEGLELKYKSLLAAWLGVYSLGAARFLEVCGGRLIRTRTSQDSELDSLAGGYERSPFVAWLKDEIVEYLVAKWRKRHRGRNPPAEERDRMGWSADTDAEAVDWVLTLNEKAVKVEQTGGGKMAFLYLSSAQRSDFIFGLEAVNSRILSINRDELVSIHRTPFHVYSSLVSQTTPSRQEKFLQANFSELMLTCSGCERHERSTPPCEWHEFCSSITEKRTKTQNLTLFKVAREYHLIRRGLQRKTKKDSPYERFVTTLRKLHGDGRLDAAVDRRVKVWHYLMTTEVEFAPHDPGSGESVSGPWRIPLKEKRDEITSADLYLPMNPHVVSLEYQSILKAVLAYYRRSPYLMYDDWKAFESAYLKFLEIDANKPASDDEHELVRCYLFLAFPEAEGDQEAAALADDMVKIAKGRMKAEFQYVTLWAKRRLRKFADAYKLASDCITLEDSDPRFWHGRSLANYSWYADKTQRPAWQQSRLNGEEAIKDLERALELYGRNPTEYSRQIGAAHCNLAYFLVFEPGFVKCDPARARIEFGELRKFVPEEEWDPAYPEYMAGEAQVTLYECRAMSGSEAAKRKTELRRAAKVIKRAFEIFPKDTFRAIQEEILGEQTEGL